MNKIISSTKWMGWLGIWLVPVMMVGMEPLMLSKTVKPPVIDGILDDECYRTARQVDSLKPLSENTKLREPTTVFLTYDESGIYLAARCQESQMKNLKTRMTVPDSSIWSDDCVEVFLNLGLEESDFYHLIVNSAGVRYDAKVHVLPSKAEVRELNWDGDWRVATHREVDAWTVELALPFYVFEMGDGPFRLNFAREEKPNNELSSLSGAFGDPSRFPLLAPLACDFSKFMFQIKEVVMPFLGWGKNSFSIKVKNRFPSTKDEPSVVVRVDVRDAHGKEVHQMENAAVVRGGETKEIALVTEVPELGKTYRMNISLLDEKQRQLRAQYSRWIPPFNLLEMGADRGIYYLSDKQAVMLIEVCAGLQSLSDLLVSLTVCRPGDSRSVFKVEEKMDSREMKIQIPFKTLDAGTWQVHCTVRNKNGSTMASNSITFHLMKGPFD